MKAIIMLWLMTAGLGVSYAIYEERKNRLKLLQEMEQSLGKLVYFMYQWRMPAEEAFTKMLRESFTMLHPFFVKVLEGIKRRNVENLGNLWKLESDNFFDATTMDKEIKEIWSNCFLNIPLEPEALQKSVLLIREEIQIHLESLRNKYKMEHRLIWTLGVCTSAFLCLIIW